MWGPYASSNGEWIAKNILGGFFAAPIEALPEVSVTDLYFHHQRGTYMGLYAFFLAGSNYFAPVICGFIADRQGWKWVFYWPTIFLGVGLIWCFFFLEESNYKRTTVGIVETNSGSQTPTSVTTAEKTGEKLPEVTKEPATVESGKIAYGSNKTYLQRLSLWQPSRGENMLPRAIRSLKYLGWPVIFYAGFSYGSYLVSWPLHHYLDIRAMLTRLPVDLVQRPQRHCKYHPRRLAVQLQSVHGRPLLPGNMYRGLCRQLLHRPIQRLAHHQTCPTQQWHYGTGTTALAIRRLHHYRPGVPYPLGCGSCPPRPLVWLDLCNGDACRLDRVRHHPERQLLDRHLS
jgi:hypothetical protein